MRATLRRAIPFRKRFWAYRSGAAASGHRHDLERPGDPPDVLSVRAKSMRHGKSTADKWNQ